jgi:hypothetical protein
MSFMLKIIDAPEICIILTIFTRVTVWIDWSPLQPIPALTLEDLAEHDNPPYMGNKWLVETSLDHCKDDGNMILIVPPTGI